MTDLRKAAEMAQILLNTTESIQPFHEERTRVLLAIRAALAETEQEPVTYQYQDTAGKWCDFIDHRHYENTVKDGRWPIRALYTRPATPLNDEQIARAWAGGDHNASAAVKRRITRAIEAELGVKK